MEGGLSPVAEYRTAVELAQTFWRGMRIGHPADWELIRSSGLDEPGRCLFADRLHQRLDIRWRPLKYAPDLETMLKPMLGRRRGRRLPKHVERIDITGVPAPWQAVAERGEVAMIVHAGRFFREARLLAEVTLIWPGEHDRRLENAVLSSLAIQKTGGDTRHWRAMGIDVEMPTDYDLHECSARVGRVQWTFRPAGKASDEITIERFAMPETWLKGPLRDWLEQDLPTGHKSIRQDPAMVNTHRGEQLISHSNINPVSRLRGVRRVRLAVAWLCPAENRLYRVCRVEDTRQQETSLPDRLKVLCCQSLPASDPRTRS